MKFTAAEVQMIIEADRAGRIHLEPRDYTEATLAAALKQYRDLPMVGTEAHPGYQHAWGKNDLCIYKGCKAGPAELNAERQAARPKCGLCGEPSHGRAKSVADARRIIVDLVKYTPMTSAATMQLARVDAYLYEQYRTA